MRRAILFCLLVVVAGTVMAQESTEKVTVTVKVEGVSSSKGQLLLGVFNSEKDFLKNKYRAMAIDLEKEGQEAYTFTIEDLPAGTYAMSVIHDENKNRELDMGMMGPVEDYGFSRDARGTFGPPPFREAAMKVESDTTITIKIN